MAEEEKNLEQKEEEIQPDENQVSEPAEEAPAEKTEGDEGYQGRFNQFKAQNADEYIQMVEDAYLNSSQEGQRLKKDLTAKEQEMEVISKVIQADPDMKKAFADKLYDGDYDQDDKTQILGLMRQVVREELGQNPVLKRGEDERKAKDKETYDALVKEHPEIETNPKIAEELEVTFGTLAALEQKKNGTVDFEKTLKKAFGIVSEDKELEGMKKVYQKENAQSGSQPSEGKPAGRALTELERTIAKNMGLTDEQYLDGKKQQEEAKITIS